MNVKRYLEILELQPGASLEELNQAYKDLVNIWHPDRFAHNPRLKGKAEKKLKEVNQAYEALRPLLSSGSGLGKNRKPGSRGHAQADAGIEEETSSVRRHAGAKSQTEALVEASTANVLRMWSYLSTRLRRLVVGFRHSRREHTQINRGQTEAKVAAWAGAKERAGGDLDANAWEGEKEEPAVEGE